MQSVRQIWQERLSRRGRLSLLVGVGVVAFLLLLPIVVRLLIIYLINRGDIGEATLEDVDLNLFTGELELKRFTLKQHQQSTMSLERAYLNFGWLGLLELDYRMEALQVEGMRLNVDEDEAGIWHILVPLGGGTSETATAEQTAEEPLILPKLNAYRIEFTDADIHIRGRQFNGHFRIETLNLTRLSSWSPDPATLTLSAHWNQAPIKLTLTAELIKEIPTMEGKVSVSGFQLRELLPVLQSVLPSDSAGESPFNQLDGAVGVSLDISGNRNPEGMLSIEVDGDVDIQQVALAYGQYASRIASASMVSKASLHLKNGLQAFDASSDIQLRSFNAIDREQQLELASFEALSLQKLQIDQTQQASLAALTLQHMNAFRPQAAEQSWLRNGRLTLQSLIWDGKQRLHIGEIRVRDLQYQLERDNEGQWLLAKAVSTGATSTSDAAEAAPPPEQPTPSGPEERIQFAIDRFQLEGENYVVLTDRSVNPAFQETLHLNTFRLSDLDSAQPDSHTDLSFNAAWGEFTTIAVDGWLAPFSEGADTGLKGEVLALSLPPLSGYAEQAIGYRIPKGQFDLRFDLQVSDQMMKMTNGVTLRRFDLEVVDDQKTQKLSDDMGVSLGLGLDLMRDSDDNIRLELPIAGRLDNPDVRLNTLIAKALGKAITKSSLSYLQYAMQPYGAVLMAGNLLSKQLSAVEFEPVPFEVGSSELPAARYAYLDKLAALLTEREAIELDICGFANEQDRQLLLAHPQNDEQAPPAAKELDPQLTLLAEQRAVTVKRYLLEKEIASTRLLLCQPAIREDAVMGVTLSM